jgi:hypothetical protein
MVQAKFITSWGRHEIQFFAFHDGLDAAMVHDEFGICRLVSPSERGG